MATSSLHCRLPEELSAKLEKISLETGRNKSYYVREALEKFLEDREDYLLAIATIEKNNPKYTLAEVKKRLGLED